MGMGTDATVVGRSVEGFNALDGPEAAARAASCLSVPRWVEAVVSGRPYSGWAALSEKATAAATDLTDAELEGALARHPRIGERAGGQHDAAFSAQEQSGVDPADTGTTARLAAGNVAYEQRFDRVFLIRAAGRSSEEILAELERRLANDDRTERGETVTQLREIALRRLREVAT